MRELTTGEIVAVSGAGDGQISGYEGAGAVLAVLGAGAAVASAPISVPVAVFAISVAGGLALSQFIADL